MIHTTFRVNVATPTLPDDLVLDAMTLSSIFKSASASHEIVPNFGLPVEAAEEDAQGKADADALIDAAKKVDAVGKAVADVKEKAEEIGILNHQGRLITPEALDIYRETFVMRRSFGIPNTKRTNIDTSSKKLPKILPENVERYFPIPSAEQLARAAMSKPKTLRQQIADTLSSYPAVLPTLALRVSLLHRPLWERDDEVARHNWKKAMRPQLDECLYELQKDLMRLDVPSNVRREVKDLMRFERLELRFDKYILSIANESTNHFGEVGETLDLFYKYLNDGAFGDKEVIKIDAPYIDYELVRMEDEKKRAQYEQHVLDREEQQRLQAEREAKWELEAKQAEELIKQGEQASEAEEVAEAVDPEVVCEDEGAIPDEQPEVAEGDEQADGEQETGDAEEEVEEKEPSHYQGYAALKFSEETIYETRMNEYETAKRKAQAAAEKEELRRQAAEEGITLLPELHDRVWSVIFSDGSLAYFDSLTGEFCTMPEPVEEEADELIDEEAEVLEPEAVAFTEAAAFVEDTEPSLAAATA